MSMKTGKCPEPDKKTIEGLIKQADEVRENCYAPYSGFCVGAALLTDEGDVFTGVNVENSSYPAGICAERNAIFKALSEGRHSFRAIAIAGGRKNRPETERNLCFPCGICRQVMSEHCKEDFLVICAADEKNYRIYTLAELLPHSFGPYQLEK